MVSTSQILNKRKRLSKKNKKAWRKHTDIKDVEKFLAEKINEERTGGNPSEKKDTDLFYIDKSDIFETSKSKLGSMKCHSDLQIDTRVAPVIGYSGPRKKKRKRTAPILPSLTLKNTISTPMITPPDKNVRNKISGSYDIWGEPSAETKVKDPCLPPPVLPPHIYKAPDTKLRAVELPHPGASYNPTLSDHQELLQSALDVEVKREKCKAKATRDAAPAVKITEEEYLNEMSIGLSNNENEVEKEFDSDNAANCPIALTTASERKTRVQRNKQKAERVKAADIVAAKQVKRISHQLNRVKSVEKEIKREEREMGVNAARKQIKRREKHGRPGKYGPGKLLEEQPDYLLPEEVSSSLRQLINPISNVKERFTSLQKRNMIEVRKKVAPHRKYKVKLVEKWRKKLPEEIEELVKLKKKKKKKIKITE